MLHAHRHAEEYMSDWTKLGQPCLTYEVMNALLQVKSTDEEGLSPPNLLVIDENPERGYGSERHYIPYVPQIVKEIDTRTQELLVKPPKGLLQLGRERSALRYVEPQLKVQTLTARQLGKLVFRAARTRMCRPMYVQHQEQQQ